SSDVCSSDLPEMGLYVLLVIEYQGLQHGHPLGDVFVEHGIEIGQQLVAQLYEFLDDPRDLVPKGPWLLVPVVPTGVYPAEGVEDRQLDPTGEEFPIGLFGKAADIGSHKGITADAHALHLDRKSTR